MPRSGFHPLRRARAQTLAEIAGFGGSRRFNRIADLMICGGFVGANHIRPDSEHCC
jgi:hypothetical protein